MEQALQRRPWLTPTLLALLSVLFFGGVFWTPGEALAGADTEALFIPWLTHAAESIRQGMLPLWDTHQFSGYPFFANIQAALFYPPTWLCLILPVSTGLAVSLALHVWLGGWGMARLVRWLGGSQTGALTAGVVFAFSGFTAARVAEGHIGVINTLAWTPWVVLAYWWGWAMRKGRWFRPVLAGAPLAMAVLAGHITSMLYVGLILLAAAIYQAVAVETGDWKARLAWAGAPLVVMAAVGTALAGVQLVPTLEFAARSTRLTPDYAELTRFSLYPEHLLTLAAPDFFGQPLITGYWAQGSYPESIYYVGVLPLLLALMALRAPRLRRAMIFLASLAGVGLLLALGVNGPLYPVVYRLLPVFRLARAPARAGFLFLFGASALAGLAVTLLADPVSRPRLLRPLRGRWPGVVIGGAALAALVAYLLFALNLPDSEAGRLYHMGSALLLFALWAALGVSALVWWGRAGTAAWAPLLVIALALLDLWTFGLRLVRTGPPPPHPVWATVRSLTGEAFQEEGPFRVLPWGMSIFWQNGATLTDNVESVFGYNAMELSAYSAFVSAAPDWRAPAYDLLNARYLAHAGALDEAEGLAYLGEGYGVYLYERPGWMPRAWLAGRYEVTADPVTRLNQPDFDYRAVVLLEQEPPCAPAGGDSGGRVEVVAETATRVELSVTGERDALLVYSGVHYPGWTAAVDGAPAEVLRADGILRGVCVPAGRHTVTMDFLPASLVAGGVITLAALALLAIAARAMWHAGRSDASS